MSIGALPTVRAVEEHVEPLAFALKRHADFDPSERRAVNVLAAQHPHSAPFVNLGWLHAWTRAFAPGKTRYLCAYEAQRLVAMMPLLSRAEPWHGRRMRVLGTPTNSWSSRFEILTEAGRPDLTQAMVARMLRGCGTHDVVQLEYVPTDASWLPGLLEAGASLGWRPYVEPSFPSPYKLLPQDPEAWKDGLKRKFLTNLRNRHRRLEKLWPVSFEIYRGQRAIQSAFELFCILEARSWKGAEGTAILSHPASLRLYESFLRAHVDDFWIPVLRLKDRPIAAHLIVRCDRTLFLLKTGFDPDYGTYSPGQLITQRLIQQAISEGYNELDFLGEPMVWKSDWAPAMRAQSHVYLFAPTREGQFAYWSRFGWRDAVKKTPGVDVMLQKWRGRRRR